MPPREGTVLGTITRLIQDGKVKPTEIFDAISNQKMELVLTAHPTEVGRCDIILRFIHVYYITYLASATPRGEDPSTW
jgi:phosphoenolpyruvate carboxylase